MYVLIVQCQCVKMGLQRRLGIYVDYESPTILKYLESLIGYLFIAHFADYQFDEVHFPILGGRKDTF